MKKHPLQSYMLDEERITNPESKNYVLAKQNFIGSHIFGEWLGDIEGPEGMYVSFSYNEDFPAYLWYKDQWYHNTDEFINPDGKSNRWHKKHMEDMRPSNETHALPTSRLLHLIKKFKKIHKIKELEHTSVLPGEKN